MQTREIIIENLNNFKSTHQTFKQNSGGVLSKEYIQYLSTC